jgi:hypothetical protein
MIIKKQVGFALAQMAPLQNNAAVVLLAQSTVLWLHGVGSRFYRNDKKLCLQKGFL